MPALVTILSSRHRRAVSSTPIPLQYSTTKWWYPGTQDATLLESTSGGGGGTPSVGGAVGRIKGYAYDGTPSGTIVNGFDAVSSSKRATRVSGGGIQGDGVDDLYTGFSGLDCTSGFCVMAVFYPADSGSNKGIMGRWGASGNQWGLLTRDFSTSTDSKGIVRNSSNSATGSVSHAGTYDGAKRFIGLHWDTTTLTLNLDGTEYTSAVSSINASATGVLSLLQYLSDGFDAPVSSRIAEVWLAVGNVSSINSTVRASYRTDALARY